MNNNQVIMKQDTSENWAKCEDKYIPMKNTLLIYYDEGKQPRLKISDGIHTLGELDFINNESSLQPIVVEDTLEL